MRLYVAGQTVKSLAAMANLRRVCEEHLAGRYDIEVVDLLVNPKLAAGDQILAIPTLVRRLPAPLKRIIGDLSNTERVLVGLDIRPKAAPPSSGAPDDTTSPHTYLLKLFVAGSTMLSQHAVGNLRRICDAHLPGQVDLEVIDIYQQPELAGQHQVVAVPTLLKLRPLPVRRVIGDLSATERVLRGWTCLRCRRPDRVP